MSYDLYIVTGERQVESVFNASIYNMPPFINACIDALNRKINVMESQLRDNKSELDKMVQGEINEPDHLKESALAYQRNLVEHQEQLLIELNTSLKAWVRVEQGEEVPYIDLCMIFTFDFPAKFLTMREEDYARYMVAGLVDCARHHGNVQAYIA